MVAISCRHLSSATYHPPTIFIILKLLKVFLLKANELQNKEAIQVNGKAPSLPMLSSKVKGKTGGGNSGTLPLASVSSVVETRVPVVLVVGGAGAGKTAVAAAVLNDASTHHHLRVLALVPSVEAFRDALQRAGGSAVDEPLPLGCDVVQVVEEVSGGCVCCTVRRDIEDVLADEALAGAPSFDLVVIDTSSTSDPMPVIATLFEEHANEVVTPEVSQCFHLDAVVCVVDGRTPDTLGRTVHEARQLAFADVIVVTHAQHRRPGGLAGSSSSNSSNRPLLGDGHSGSSATSLASTMPKSQTLSISRPPCADNRSLSASTAATSHTPLLPESARERICGINPLVQVCLIIIFLLL